MLRSRSSAKVWRGGVCVLSASKTACAMALVSPSKLSAFARTNAARTVSETSVAASVVRRHADRSSVRSSAAATVSGRDHDVPAIREVCTRTATLPLATRVSQAACLRAR